MHYYVDKVFSISGDNLDITRTIVEVLNLLKPPSAFFAPSIVARVLQEIIAPTHPAGAQNDKEMPLLQERMLDGTS